MTGLHTIAAFVLLFNSLYTFVGAFVGYDVFLSALMIPLWIIIIQLEGIRVKQ